MKITEPEQPQINQSFAKEPRSGFARFVPVAGLLLALLAFTPALFHYFTGEDFVFIKSVADGQAFYEPTQRLFYRPLPNLLWQADYALWKLNSSGYHLTNLLLHLLNAWLVGRLAQKLGGSRFVSYLAATIFALHPAHIEAVDWLASRPDLLATFFCLLSTLWGLSFFSNSTQAQKPPLWLYILSVLAFAAGLFSKEAAAGLPFALFGIILGQRRGQGWKKLSLWLLPYLLVGALYGLARYTALGGFGGYSSDGHDLFYIAWNLTGGLWLPLLFPINIESAGVFVATVAAAILALIYAGLFWQFWRDRRSAIAKQSWLSALVFMYGTLLPALNTAPVDTNLAQSRILYLPSVGFCLLLAIFIQQTRVNSVQSPESRVQSPEFKLLSTQHSALSTPNSLTQTRLIVNGPGPRSRQSSIVNPLLLALLIWQVAVLQVNLAPWQQIGEMVRKTFTLLDSYNLPVADGDTFYFKGLPDSYHGAYGWRNGLEAAASLITGHKVGGFNQTPDLKVDYRLADSGRLWFLQYQSNPDTLDLSLKSVYNAGPEQTISNNSAATNWDFSTCSENSWNWNSGAGQLQCLKDKGLEFNTLGKKTAVTGTSPATGTLQDGWYYLDITTYVNFDFEQPVVVGDAYLLDTETKQELAYFPFDFAADGHSHTYRLYLKPVRPISAAIISLKASKMRSNLIWQHVSFGKIKQTG
jgi:hypothetical protein